MAKFKVGDRVKCVASEDGRGCGLTGSVADSGTIGVKVDFGGDFPGHGENGHCWYFYDADRQLELVTPEFKVGDKVRFTADNPNGGVSFGKKGDVAIVLRKVDFTNTYYGAQVVVDLVGHPNVPVSVLELAPTTLAIEAGKFYKTRDGRKVGPMRSDAKGWLYTHIDGMTRSFKIDGGKHQDNSNLDLVAEWTAADVFAPLSANNDNVYWETPKRQFPVGSRVVRKDSFHNDHGTVTGHIDGRYNTVKWDDGLGSGNTWQDHELRLVAPATSGKFKVGDLVMDISPTSPNKTKPATVTKVSGERIAVTWPDGSGGSLWPMSDFKPAVATNQAIVCLIENGQPKPSERPHVHASRGHASDEAERLSRKFKGKQFGVYELVSTVQQPAPVYEHEWQRLAARGDKILSIKELRAKTGITLKGAKDAVEHWLAYEAA